MSDIIINKSKQIEDLKKSIRELQEYADEKSDVCTKKMSLLNSSTKGFLIAAMEKAIFSEISEHCAVAIEDNE